MACYLLLRLGVPEAALRGRTQDCAGEIAGPGYVSSRSGWVLALDRGICFQLGQFLGGKADTVMGTRVPSPPGKLSVLGANTDITLGLHRGARREGTRCSSCFP